MPLSDTKDTEPAEAARSSTKGPDWRWRGILGALLVLSIASGHVVFRYVRAVARGASSPGPQRQMVELERIFRDALSAAALDERVGFYLGIPIHADETADANTGYFYLAQFAAAPRPMVPDATPRLVLVFLNDDEALAAYATENQRTLLSHPYPGVALTERVTP